MFCILEWHSLFLAFVASCNFLGDLLTSDLECCRTQKALGVIGSSEMFVMMKPPRLPEQSHQFQEVLGR